MLNAGPKTSQWDDKKKKLGEESHLWPLWGQWIPLSHMGYIIRQIDRILYFYCCHFAPTAGLKQKLIKNDFLTFWNKQKKKKKKAYNVEEIHTYSIIESVYCMFLEEAGHGGVACVWVSGCEMWPTTAALARVCTLCFRGSDCSQSVQ